MKTIFYVGSFRFPDGNAGGQRVRGIGKAIRESGYKVVFLGAEASGPSKSDAQCGAYEYDGFTCYPGGNVGKSLPRRLWRLWHTHLTGFSAMRRLKRLSDGSAIAVIAYQPSFSLLLQLRRFCSRRSLALIGDVVEWYDSHHLPGGPLGPFAVDAELGRRYLRTNADAICAISTLLGRYFHRDDRPSIRIPPLVDLSDKCWTQSVAQLESTGRLQVAFVGSAAKKDLLVNAIRGLALLGSRGKDCQLMIVGPSRREISRNLGQDAGLLEALRDQVRFVGLLPRKEALRYLERADCSVLLRPDQRYAHAGFPTKLVESMAMGVPVICNLTSDLGLFIRDGAEGLVIKDCSPGAFADGLRRAVALPIEQRRAMRSHARERARVSFDYRSWIGPVSDFLRVVSNSAPQAHS